MTCGSPVYMKHFSGGWNRTSLPFVNASSKKKIYFLFGDNSQQNNDTDLNKTPNSLVPKSSSVTNGIISEKWKASLYVLFIFLFKRKKNLIFN